MMKLRSLLTVSLLLFSSGLIAAAADTPATHPAIPAPPSFAPTKVVTISADHGNGDLSLETGEFIEIPNDMPNPKRLEIGTTRKIDVFIFTVEPDFMISFPTAAPGMVIGRQVDEAAWDKMTAAEVNKAIEDLANAPGPHAAGLNSDSKKRQVYIFRSSLGVVGIMRVTGAITGEMSSVVIEIKHLEMPK